MKKTVATVLCALLLVSLAACTADTPKKTDVDMEALYTKLTQAAEIPQMIDLDAGLMLDYCGIRSEDVKQAKVLICSDSLRTDEIWLIEAKDAQSAKTIRELADKRLAKKGEESITYSPEQYAVVEKAELIEKDCYLAMIVSPEVQTLSQTARREFGLQ